MVRVLDSHVTFFLVRRHMPHRGDAVPCKVPTAGAVRTMQIFHPWESAQNLFIRKAIPFFCFVYCRMHFLILGRSVGERKKKAKIKLEKESGARRPGTSAKYPKSLKTTRCGNKVNMAEMEEGKSMSLFESNENREKLNILRQNITYVSD